MKSTQRLKLFTFTNKTTVFVSVCASLVAICFGASDQLVSSDLLSTHGTGGREETAQEGEGERGGRRR
jgi:hypothetical protein